MRSAEKDAVLTRQVCRAPVWAATGAARAIRVEAALVTEGPLAALAVPRVPTGVAAEAALTATIASACAAVRLRAERIVFPEAGKPIVYALKLV